MAFAAAYFAWTLDSFDFNVYIAELKTLSAEFGVSVTELMWLVTVTLLTRLLGGIVAGTLGDRYGRKWPLLLSIVWITVCDALTALAPNYTVLAIARALFGFGMGAVWVSSATLAMESWPARTRGIASGVLQGGWAVGYFLAVWVSTLLSPNWRAVFWVAAVPGLLAIPLHYYLDDHSAPSAPRAAVAPRVSWRELLRDRSVVQALIWGTFIMAFGFAEYYALTALYPTLARELVGADSARNFVMLFSLGMLVGTPLFGWIVGRSGVLTAIGVTVVGAIVVLPAYVGLWPADRPTWALAVGALGAGFFGGGVSGITPFLLTSIFPAAVRARAVGTVYNIGAFITAGVPVLAAWLTDQHGIYRGTAMALIALVSLVMMGVMVLLRPAAARQNQLEQG